MPYRNFFLFSLAEALEIDSRGDHSVIQFFFIISRRLYTILLGSVRFEVFTAVTRKNGVFWDITPCGSCKNQRFGGTWRLHNQYDKNRLLFTANVVPSSPILVTLIMEALLCSLLCKFL
jgi:hypothetical protein